MTDLPIISDLPKEKVMDLVALADMLPNTLTGDELVVYLQAVIGSFAKTEKERNNLVGLLAQRELQLKIMMAAGLDKFEEKD